MGETIRYLMVAAVTVGSVVGLQSKRFASAQGTNAQGSNAMGLPSSLSPALSNSISNAYGKPPGSLSAQPPNAGNPTPNSYPSSVSGANTYPDVATSRPGGPTTDPNAPRDNSWMSGNTATAGARPSTDPWAANSQTPSTAPSNNLSDRLRKSLPASAAAKVGSQPATGASNPAGFGTLPGGINLPVRNPPGNTNSTLAQNGFTMNQSGQGTSQVGTNSAAASHFDPSLFNTNAGNTSGSGIPGQAQPTSRNQLGFPGSNAGAPLGAPASASIGSVSLGSGVPTNWTSEQIIALGAKFGLPATDPRLNDKAFMNDLYARWQAHETKQRAATRAVAEANAAANPWGQSLPGAASRSQIENAQLERQNQLSRTASHSNLATGDPRLWGPSNPPTASGNPVTPQSRRKPLFDSFGNRVDVDGNILDDRGNPVDAATEYQLTVGKKLREDMDRLTKEREELERKKRDQMFGSPSDRVASTPPTTLGLPAPPNGSLAMNSAAFDRQGVPPSLTTQVKRPPSSQQGHGSDSQEGHLTADHAGIGGAAKAIGKSNPYINVFLLSSLVANAFLFIWLHRLWHHHRELIAASRMAASGISSSD